MNVVAFDTETRGLDWWNPDQQAFLATWADDEGSYAADLADPQQAVNFVGALRAADVLVAHNLSFDTHMVREATGVDVLELPAALHDTDLMSRVLHPEGNRGTGFGHGLKTLAKVHLREDAAASEDAIKEMGKQIGLRTLKQTGAYYDVWRAFPSVMEQYAKDDARFTRDLFQKFSADLADAARIYELEMAVAPVLIRAEQRGIKTDQEAVKRLKVTYLPALCKVRDELVEQLGEGALEGEGSGAALTEALQAHGVPLHRTTTTGKLATHKFALAEFADDYPVIAQLEEYRTLSRFMSTYVNAVDGVDVVHASFNQCEAWTGRMSCRRPNLQNFPKRAGKEVRSVLVPREGHAFVVADYESIEARLLAHYLGDNGYRQIMQDGLDPHAFMAAQIWGGEMADYFKGTPGQAKRDVAKNTTYAIVYGAGAPRVADMNGISRDEAKALISQIKASLPGYYKLQKRIRTKIEKVGYVNTLFGRKNPVNPDKAYVGLNALIQGSAADIMKQGLVNVDAAVRDLGATPLLVVHDEVVVEVPLPQADECQRRVEAALVSAYDLYPALTVESSIVTTSYADA